MNKIITYNYNAALHILQQCKSEQQSQIDNVLVFILVNKTEIAELQKEIISIESELNLVREEDERDLPQNEKKVNKLSLQLNSLLNYEMELNLLAMKIGIKEDMKNNIFHWIQDTYLVDVEFASINGGKFFKII